ncbi:hypothetical protein V2W45_1465807 [Cenococcum geophilum]
MLIYLGNGSTLELVRHCLYTLRRLLSSNYAIIPITGDTIIKEPYLVQYEFKVNDKEIAVVRDRKLAFFPGICHKLAFLGIKIKLKVDSGEGAAVVIYRKVSKGGIILTGPYPKFAAINLSKANNPPFYSSTINAIIYLNIALLPAVSIEEKIKAEKTDKEDKTITSDKIINYNRVIKKVIIYKRELLLKPKFGKHLLYSEVVTSTNILLEKNPKLLRHLPPSFTAIVAPPSALIFSTLKWLNNVYALDPTLLGNGKNKANFVKIGGILVNSSYAGSDYTLVMGIRINVVNVAPIISLNALAVKASVRVRIKGITYNWGLLLTKELG